MAQKNSRLFSFIGQNIKKIRQAKNISQSEFASLFNLSRPSVGAYEEGRTEPKIETLIQISRHFNISIDVLLTRELSSKDVFSLGLLNKKLDAVHESKSPGRKVVTAPFVSITERVNFLVNHLDRQYMSGLTQLGVPEKKDQIDLIIENEGTKLEVDNKGIHHQDLLLCSKNSKLKSSPEELWLIITERDFVVGRISNQKEGTITIDFDNRLYEQKIIERDRIISSYLIIGVYTRNISRPHSLEGRLLAIEEKLKKL
ncbi:MAG: helix-turn-helix transcriptional regulator [Ekhidna sp.]|nr:helix-turn-helix transcriptional regulator [Ekhidna sp.]